jgi:formylglycine-generating enzyme required for sulfatase activity
MNGQAWGNTGSLWLKRVCMVVGALTLGFGLLVSALVAILPDDQATTLHAPAVEAPSPPFPISQPPTAPSAAFEAPACPAGYIFVPASTTADEPSGSGAGPQPLYPTAPVAISRPICVAATEVTQQEWQSLMGSNPSFFQQCGSTCPVDQVSWFDAVSYANVLSRREGLPTCYDGATFVGTGCRGYRLPTEAEWTYAAHAGHSSASITSIDPFAWHPGNSKQTPHAVGTRQPNEWGLYDMVGNVWEWTQEFEENTGTRAPASGISGGSWYSPSDGTVPAHSYTSADRRWFHVGIRLVKTWTSDPPENHATPSNKKDFAFDDGSETCPRGFALFTPVPANTGSSNGLPQEIGRAHGPEVQPKPIKAFCLQETEVTQAQWTKVMGYNPSQFRACGPDCPVEQVTWFDATRFADELSALSGLPRCDDANEFNASGCRGFRLPTAAEWDFAVNMGNQTPELINAGSGQATNLSDIAWYRDNAQVDYATGLDCSDWFVGQTSKALCGTHPVRRLKPNGAGLYDMLGSVWEWTSSAERVAPIDEEGVEIPPYVQLGDQRVMRGGGWALSAESVQQDAVQVAPPRSSNEFTGFRVAISAKTPDSAAPVARGEGSGSSRNAIANLSESESNLTKNGIYFETTSLHRGVVNLANPDLPACIGQPDFCPKFSGAIVDLAFSFEDEIGAREFLAVTDFNTTAEADEQNNNHASSSAGAVYEIRTNLSKRSVDQLASVSCGEWAMRCSPTLASAGETAIAIFFGTSMQNNGLLSSDRDIFIISRNNWTTFDYQSSYSNSGFIDWNDCNEHKQEDAPGEYDTNTHFTREEMSSNFDFVEREGADFPDIRVTGAVNTQEYCSEPKSIQFDSLYRFENGYHLISGEAPAERLF